MSKQYSILDHLTKTPPEVLYHYTSLEVLQHVVSRGRLWASDIQYMNDSTESTHLLDLLSSRVRWHIANAAGKRYASLTNLLKLIETGWRDTSFAICFSEKRDDLSQWRGYSPQGLGVCIGFSTSSLKSTNPFNFGWSKSQSFIPPTEDQTYEAMRLGMPSLVQIIYVSEDAGADFDWYIERACCEDGFNKPSPSAIGIHALLAHNAAFYKSSTFTAEQEWRLILTRNTTTDQALGVRFRQGKSTLIPFVEVDISRSDHPFVAEVIVGPTPNMTLSVDAVHRMLLLHGMSQVKVRPSSVPYRPW